LASNDGYNSANSSPSAALLVCDLVVLGGIFHLLPPPNEGGALAGRRRPSRASARSQPFFPGRSRITFGCGFRISDEDAFGLAGEEAKVAVMIAKLSDKKHLSVCELVHTSAKQLAVETHLSIVDAYRILPPGILSPGFLSGLFHEVDGGST
jgi:hypothetical protein